MVKLLKQIIHKSLEIIGIFITTVILFILILVLFNFNYFQNVYKYSKGSVDLACNPEIAKENNVVALGSTKQYPNGTIEVTFYGNFTKQNPLPSRILKHEWVHVKQTTYPFYFSASCDHQTQKLIREMEAYISEGLNPKIYNLIYGDIKIG